MPTMTFQPVLCMELWPWEKLILNRSRGSWGKLVEESCWESKNVGVAMMRWLLPQGCSHCRWESQVVSVLAAQAVHACTTCLDLVDAIQTV